MFQTKRAHEGYLMINHKDSPGVSDGLLREVASRSSSSPLPPGSGRGMFEAPMITCSHCQKGVVVNPLRNHERSYCIKCDHYICDNPCGLDYKISGGVCRSYAALVDRLYEQGLKEMQRHG